MPLSPNELELLIAAAKTGSKEALGDLLEHFRDYLRKQARLHLDPELKAKMEESELVQETLLAAIKGFPEFKGFSEGEITAWLARILVNRASNLNKHFRGTGKRDLGRERPLVHNIEERAQTQERTDCERLEAGWRRDEREDLMTRSFGKLPADYQLIVKFHHHEKMTFEEVAAMMDRSVEAVKKLWTRAVRCWSDAVKTLEKEKREN